MGNSLLDFVLSLVRDPDVAARYAADPTAVLTAAGLPGVTAADVDNLLPMVADSLSMSTPVFGFAPPAAVPGDHEPGGGNVWASGAATAALDAFESTSTGVSEQQNVSPAVVPVVAPVASVQPSGDHLAAQPLPVPAADVDLPLAEPSAWQDHGHDAGADVSGVGHDHGIGDLPADHPHDHPPIP